MRKREEEGMLVALDVGATGMKIVTALLAEESLQVQEVELAPTRSRVMNGCSYIAIDVIQQKLIETIARLIREKKQVLSVGVDTFGNGYGLLDEKGDLLMLPYDYRDARVEGIMSRVHRFYRDRQLYDKTGNFPFQTRGLFHLYQDVLDQTVNIRRGKCFLPLPNLLEYLFTGSIQAERTFCSVLYMLDSQGKDWNWEVFRTLGIPTNLFPPISEPGKRVGVIGRNCPDEIAAEKIPMIDVIGHDTESALIMAPDMDDSHAFVCMGTSFILGTRLSNPLINDLTYQYRFKNMRGAFGKYSLCQDFPGFWLLEQCMELWKKEKPDLSYEDVNRACQEGEENRTYLDINDEVFRLSGKPLLETIAEYCIRTAQPVIKTMPQVARCLYESYCCFIRWNIEALQRIIGRPIEVLDIFNGGTKNSYLMQMLADASGRLVVTNGRYASAYGNLLMQYAVRKTIDGMDELGEMAKRLAQRKTYRPRTGQKSIWDKRFACFLQVKPWK